MQQVHCALRVNEPPDGFTYTPFLLAVTKKIHIQVKVKVKGKHWIKFFKIKRNKQI